MSRQLGLSPRDLVLWLCVKFYTPDPAKLEDELTRYLFSLQIRRDLAQDQLKCNSKTAAVLVSYIVQCEYNDQRPAICTSSHDRATFGQRLSHPSAVVKYDL